MKFTVLGDWGYDTIHRKNIIRSLGTKGVDFNILLGDNFYPNGVSGITDYRFRYFENDFGNINNYVILGNHDWLQDEEAQILYTIQSKSWTMPYFFYDFVRENIHFIMLDTCSIALETTRRLTEAMEKSFSDLENKLCAIKKKQMKWLKTTLEKSRYKIKIVCGHYPIFSNGIHGNNNEMIRDVLPILCYYKVDAYLCGHDHSIQHIHKYGIHFYVLGSGSESSHIMNIQDGTKFSKNICGFAQFTSNPDGIEIELNDEFGNIHMYNLYYKKIIF